MTLETKPKHNAGNEQKNKLKKETIVIAAFDTDPRSRDIAKEKMTANKEELKGIRGFWKKIWTHNLAKPYYEHKEMEKARRIIKDSGNIYSTEKGDKIDEKNAMKALTESTIKKFTSEYEEEMIHTEAGEKKKSLKEENPEEKAFKSKVKELIEKYAKGEIEEEQFLNEKQTFINSNFGKIKDEKGEGLAFKNSLYADNLLEVARQVKQKFSHTGSLDALDLDFDIVMGKSKTGARTEANLDWTERTINKITKTIPGGILVNEATLALVVSVASKIAVGYVRRFSKILGPLGFAASAGVGGMVAGIKESGRLKEDRAQHSRERTEGKNFGHDAERRKEMEEFRYETKGADELTEKLQKSLRELQSGKINENSLNSILNNLKEVEARISYSDRKNIDLIHYSDTKNIEQERMGIDLARAESKVFLRKIANGEIRGFDKSGFSFLKNKEALEKHLEEIREKHIEDFFQKEISEKNEAFEKMRVKEVWKSFKKGALVGAGVGLVAQELASAIGIGGNQGLLGAKEAYAGDGTSQVHHFTALEYLRRYMSGDMPRMDSSHLHETIIGDNHFKLPEGADFHKNADGTFDLLRNGNPIAKGLSLDEHGGLTEEAKNALTKEGVLSHNTVTNVNSAMETKEYVKEHEDLFKKIKRGPWGDNDTPKPDKNELKLWWGGEKGTGIDKNGNYVFNIKHMKPEGSYHGGKHWNPQELMKEGKMKILISLSHDSQNKVAEVFVDANGNGIIPADSELGKVAFENVDGHAKFLGQFAEAAVMNEPKDGTDIVNSLATFEGKGLDNIIPEKEIPTTIFDIPEESEVDWPAAFPILGRRPLERTKKETPPIYYGAGSAEEILKEFHEKNINLDPYQIINKGKNKLLLDKDGNEINRDIKRENQRIKNYLDTQESGYLEELQKLNQNLEPMDENCRICINIPARMEEKNIINLLEQFSKQTNRSGKSINPNLFEINIIINKKKSEISDKSMQLIEGWKKSHPEIRINALDVSFDDKKACVGLARKYITDLSLLRSISRKKQAGPLYIESEDADMFGVDKRMVWKLINDFDKTSSTDILRGVQDRQPEILQKNDLLFFSKRLWDFTELALKNQKYRPEKNPQADFTWQRIISGGWNTAYSAEVYSQIGGYNGAKVIGEDMEIGQKISVLRGSTDNKTGRFVPNTQTASLSGLRSSSSPRRFIDTIARDIGPYDDFESQKLKDLSIDELLDKIKEYKNADRKNIDRYQREFTSMAKWLGGSVFKGNSEWKEVMKRTLTLGIGLREGADYKLTDNDAILSPQGMDKIIENLNKYKKEKRWRLGYTRQNNPLTQP